MRFSPLDMQIEKLSQAQKKIIIIGFFIISAFIIFWFFIYSPSRNTVKRIKLELISTENQIQEIEGMVGEAKNMDEGIKLLKGKCQQLNNKFPQEEEDALRMLSETAQKLKIELVSIKPQPKIVFLDADNKEINIEGRTCQRAFVSIEMKGPYKDLVKYIQNLKDSVTALVDIERLKINKEESGPSKLNITLELNLYLLS